MRAVWRGPTRQHGFSLLEGLIAIVVFSLGALGMIEMQARAVQLSVDAQERANASFLINRLISQIALQDATVADPDPSADFLLARRACSDGVPDSHPAAAWMRETCAAFDDARITIVRPSGVGTGFLTITLEWRGRYKMNDGTTVIRDDHRLDITNRFQWQS